MSYIFLLLLRKVWESLLLPANMTFFFFFYTDLDLCSLKDTIKKETNVIGDGDV